MAGSENPREQLEQQRRLADPWFARRQRDRPGHESSAQDPIESPSPVLTRASRAIPASRRSGTGVAPAPVPRGTSDLFNRAQAPHRGTDRPTGRPADGNRGTP